MNLAVQIQIDDREQAGGLPAAIARLIGSPPRVCRLAIGDVRVGDLLLERKTVADLVASLLDGRLVSQLTRLTAIAAPLRAAVLLEGEPTPAALGGLPRAEYLAALLRIQIDYRLPLCATRNVEESAELIVAIARGAGVNPGALPFDASAVAHSSAPGRRNSLRPVQRGQAALQLAALRRIPGVGPGRAEALLAEFGTLHQLARADAAEIARVPGISQELAAAILAHLRRSS